ncbi:MAG: APC family permease [Chloroflexota bacterium]|nr:APC family permease [Chloroflexota bacterium]
MSSNRPPDRGRKPEPPPVDSLLEVREKRRGQRPGDSYVRIVRPFEDEFERGEEGTLIASESTLLGRSGFRSVLRRIRTVLIGRPISSDHELHERLTKLKALAIFSSDNISSSAYATEEMMRILILGGIGALSLTMPITVGIVVILAIVASSYMQTIKAYPNGASSYIVASDNLGTLPGLTAAAALLIDYILTVAVSVSAGVAAITSIVPSLVPERVLIAVVIVLVLMLGNLRGIRESGSIFMAPTYLYILTVGAMIAFGLVRQLLLKDLGPFVPPPDWPTAGEGAQQMVGLAAIFLTLRAFSSGAAGLTGVEAVSDGVPAFQPPEWRNARITLAFQVTIFGALFLGISYLAGAIHVIPDPNEVQTVLSLLTRHVMGDGWFLVLIQVATALVLALAANTSFADFPRLSSFLARDGFMPRSFGFRGERLAFTTGIIALSALAALLLVVFGASVTALIPLYTLGVFVAFTLSQSGMVVRWWRRREPGWRVGLAINGLGAVTTAVIVVIVASTKFLSGAWLVMVMAPILILLMLSIRGHYRSMSRQLQAVPGTSDDVEPDPIVIVPLARLDRPARRALAFARTISPRATAVHITNDPHTADRLRDDWQTLRGPMELVVVESPYRALVGPLLRYMDALQSLHPSRPIVVVLAEVVPRHWWENLLHNQTSLRLKLRLFGRKNTIVVDVPFHLGGD